MAIGSIADVLLQWEHLGFFDFVLPFLLIFAVVYGILTYMKLFGENKGIQIIVALVLGLLSIRAQFFTAFLAEITPRLGVGLTILLAILILIGLFVPDDHQATIGWVLIGVAVIIIVVILSQLYNIFNFFGGGFGYSASEILAFVIMLAVVIVVIVVLAIGGKDHKSPGKTAAKNLASLFK